MLAHDMKRAAHWSIPDTASPRVVVVAIDDVGYQSFFSAKSPIDRDQVRQLLQTVSSHAPRAQRIILDLDLSPVPGQAAGQKALDGFFMSTPKRWVLATVNSGSAADIAAQRLWRKQLCLQGVSFGLPSLPHQFGYPRLTHQYQSSLSDTAFQPAGSCAEPDESVKQKLMPLSATMLQTGLVIPFSGDLKALGAVLDSVEPDWIVVGGTWGSTDIFATPFGDRFGVQVHAAALSGGLEHQRVAPHLLQIIIAWLFVGMVSILLGYMTLNLNRWFTPETGAMPGHRFFVLNVMPLVFTLSVIGLLLLLAEGLSMVHARTGYWIPSSVVSCTALAAMFLVWNWGKGAARKHSDFKETWKDVVSLPIRQDIKGIFTALRVLRLGPQPNAWSIDAGDYMISRKRAAFDGLFAFISLIMQTVAPLCSVLYAVLKPA